jgi:hypothetical protein
MLNTPVLFFYTIDATPIVSLGVVPSCSVHATRSLNCRSVLIPTTARGPGPAQCGSAAMAMTWEALRFIEAKAQNPAFLLA